MKRTSLIVTLLALTGMACTKTTPPQAESSASSGTPNAPEDPWSKIGEPVKKDPLANPMFWSASKDGKTTYLLGTMHMGVDAEARLPKLVWDRLDAAPVFAMETNTADPAIIGMGARSSGTLEDDLGPDYWKKLEALIEPAILRGLNHMKPTMAAAMLSLRGLPQTPPMDGILHGRALNQNKQIVYLEPASTQAALLEKWMDVRMLKMMIDDPDGGIASSKKMLEAYTAGDETKMLALASEQKDNQLSHGFSPAEYEASMDDLLYKRNASWIDPIEKLHQQGNGFVAVGALHLVGPKSVLELLAARGFQIKRLR
jgi:uncharacterized protein